MKDLQVLPRALGSTLAAALRSFPVVILTGARQTGKSTLVQGLSGERVYLSLDDLDLLERSRREPDALLEGRGPLTLDEVQRSPDLLRAVKRRVDRRRVRGDLLLTGSANLLAMRQVSETLAGRAVYLGLSPLTRREILGLGTTGIWSDLFDGKPAAWLERVGSSGQPADWRDACRRGGYPTPAHQLDTDAERAMWFDGYVRTFLERDLTDLAAVSSLVDFRRLLRAAALRVGQVLNQAELARDLALSPATVHRHLNLLEASYQLVRLPAYAVNRTKRLTKAPKLFTVDVGLGLHLAATDPSGAHLENLVLADLLAWRETVSGRPEIHYWRTATGSEVDLVVEWRNRLLPIEIKSSRRVRLEHADGLRLFRDEYPEASLPGLLLHCGEETSWLARDVLAAPWWRVL